MMLTATPISMTSREIAELVGSRHDNVKTAIERMADRGVIELPALQEIPTSTKPVQVYLFSGERGRRDSIVVVAQLSPEFTAALVDRWQELERQQAPRLPQTMAEALRLAADQAEQMEAAQAQLEQQRPAVEFVGRYVEAEGLYALRDVARTLRANEREFVAWLEENGVMYRLSGRLTPYAQHLEAGRFRVKVGAAGNGHAFAQAKVTAKGLEWIAGKWAVRGLGGA